MADRVPDVPPITEDDMPVEAMHWTVGEHYSAAMSCSRTGDGRQFDRDLTRIFTRARRTADGEAQRQYLEQT